jgi:thioredoxin-like negative regulator of GroEL
MKLTLLHTGLLLGLLTTTPVWAQAENPLLMQGLTAFQQQQYPQAVSALEPYTRLNPKDLNALQTLSEAYLHLNQLELAEVTLNAAHGLERNHARTHFLRGQLRLLQQDYLRARSEFRSLLFLKQESKELYLYLAKTALALKNSEETQDYLKKGLDLKPDQPDQQAKLLLFMAETAPNAREIYSQIEALPLSAEMQKEVQKMFFGYLVQAGEFREIVDRSFDPILAAAKAKDRNLSTALYAELLRWLGKSSNPDVDQAYVLNRMENLYGQFPDDVVTRQQLISHYHRHDQPEKLLAMYRQELISQGSELAPKEQALLFRKIADLHLQMGYMQFAYDNYLRASDKDPTDIHSRLRLGIIFITAKDYREASRNFEKILKEQPLLHEARLYQAFAEAFNQEPDKAKQILEGLPSSFEPELQGWLRSLIANPKIEPVNEIWKRLLPEFREDNSTPEAQ